MEECVEILENYLDYNEQLKKDYSETAAIGEEEIEALKELLKRYKEEKRRRASLMFENENICNEVNANYIKKDTVGGIISHLLMNYPVDNYYDVRKETSQNIIDELRRY